MIHITYKGSANNAQLFANEMLDSGIIEKIRKNPGNLQYDYFIPISDPHSVLLIDCWKDQQALDIHHQSEMMNEILALRTKYNLSMDVKRYVVNDDLIPEYDQKFIKKINSITITRVN